MGSIASLLAGSLGGAIGGISQTAAPTSLYSSPSPYPLTAGSSPSYSAPASGGGDDSIIGLLISILPSILGLNDEPAPEPAPAPVVVPAPAPTDNGIVDVLKQLLDEVKGIKESLLTPPLTETPTQPAPAEPEPAKPAPTKPAPAEPEVPVELPPEEDPPVTQVPPHKPYYPPPYQPPVYNAPVKPPKPTINYNNLPDANNLNIRVWGDPHYELGKVKFDHQGDADKDVYNLITSDGGNFVQNTMYRRNGNIAVNGDQGFLIKGPNGTTKVQYMVDSKQLKITKPDGTEQMLDANTPEGQRLVKVPMNINANGTETSDAEVEWTPTGFRIKTFETQVTGKRSDTPWKDLNYVDLNFDTTKGINTKDNQNDNGLVASTFDKNYKGTNDKPFNVAGVEKDQTYFKVQNGDLFGSAQSNENRTDMVDLAASGGGTSK